MAESMMGLVRSHMVGEIQDSMVGEVLTCMGWVQKRRNLGSLLFVDLRDRTGLLQLVFNEETNSKELFEKASTLRSEYVIAVRGTLQKRGGAVNEKLSTGRVELLVDELRILAESDTPPFPVDDQSEVKDELRLTYRYLDLRRPRMQRNLEIRNTAARAMRQSLYEENFLEIETPVLNKSTPEGARDYLVPSRIHPGAFYALPQSPQLFKQLLMVSGCERYFQLARCFRDEDLRADRQPEFTQMDIEMSFARQEDVMGVTERMIARAFKDCLGIELSLPLPRMSWKEADERFGSDKPDLRFGMELVNVTDLAENSSFSVFRDAVQAGGSVRGINADGLGDLPRKKIDALTEFVKGFGLKGLAWMQLKQDGEVKSSFTKFLTEEEKAALIERMNAKAGDLLLFLADSDRLVKNCLGSLRVHLAEEHGRIPENTYSFCWITEFPLFSYSEEEQRLVAEHHPFTMPLEEDLPLLDTDPLRVRSQAYDITLNGYELGGGSVRISRGEIQKKMFSLLGFTEEEAMERFGFLLTAFRYGVPPHAGLAIGFDRLAMLLAGEDNIREVIAFPKVKDASCLLTKAPDLVDEKQLRELHIMQRPEEKE